MDEHDVSDERPWEQPGVVRRDCEPHRGELLTFLSELSLWCGLLALCLVVPCLIGVAAGTAACVLARRDLKQIERGLMDPGGEVPARTAHTAGLVGVAINLVWVVAVLLYVLLLC